MKKNILAFASALALLLAGCGSVEDEPPREAPAAGQTEAPADETVKPVLTTIYGTTAAVSSKPTTTTKTNLDTDIVEYTTSQQPAAELSDTADTFPEAFLSTLTCAEYRDFDETRYVIDGTELDTLRNELSAFHGKKCADPEICGSYMFVLKDNAGNEHYLSLAGDYVILNGEFYHDPEYDPDGSRSAALAEYFRANGRRAPADEATAEFELVQLSPSGKTGYVLHDTYGLTSFSLKDGSLEQMPAGTMLRISWSGRIAEIYPSILEGVTSVTRADNLANPDRPDFVTENLSALVEACRGKDDYSAELDKLTGLTTREKEALMWLVGNALAE